MSVWISEIDADGSGRPSKTAFLWNASFREPRPPSRQSVLWHAEADVGLAFRAMTWNETERQPGTKWVTPATKQNQDLAAANVKSAEPVVGFHDRVPEKA